MRPFVCGWVSACESDWVRDSVTLFLEDEIQTYIFVRSLSNFIHKSTIMRGGILLFYSKEEIWLSPIRKAPAPTEMSKGQKSSDNTNNATKSSITQRLRTGLGRSVGVTTVTQLVWLTGFTDQTFPLPATAV